MREWFLAAHEIQDWFRGYFNILSYPDTVESVKTFFQAFHILRLEL